MVPVEEGGPEPVDLPVEVEIYIEADGSVTFADLAADAAPIAHELNPDHPLACEPPGAHTGSTAPGTTQGRDASIVEGEEHEQDD